MTDEAPRSRSAALALTPGTLLAGVAGGIVFPIFPIVGQQVGLSMTFIGVILAANRAMRVLCAPLVGVLADRVGGRRTLLFGLGIQLVVMALYLAGVVFHQEGAGFLVGRLLHGPGSACVFVAASALALQAGTPGGSGNAAAIVRASIVVGVPLGLVIGGLLSEAAGNIATFAIAGGAVALALGVGAATIPDLRAPMRSRAGVLASLREMRDRRLLAIGGLNFVLGFSAGGMVLSTLAFLVESRGLSVFGLGERGTSGLLMAILSVTDALLTVWVSRLGDRHHAHAKIAAVSLGVLALGLVVIGLAHAEPVTALGIAIVGAATAGLGPSVLVMLGELAPPDRRGAAAGLLQLSGDVGAMLGPLVGTALFTTTTTLPYLVTAGLVLCFVPAGLWLVRSMK